MLGKKGDFGILGGHGPFGPPKSAYVCIRQMADEQTELQWLKGATTVASCVARKNTEQHFKDNRKRVNMT